MPKAKSQTLFCIAVVSVLMGFSQEKERPLDLDPDLRSVHGIVTYAAHEMAKGAVVKCTDTQNLQIRSYITSRDGTYHFGNLSANRDYELKAEYSGRESRVKRLNKFDGRKAATVNLRLK